VIPFDANSWHRGRSRSLVQVSGAAAVRWSRSKSVALLYLRAVRLLAGLVKLRVLSVRFSGGFAVPHESDAARLNWLRLLTVLGVRARCLVSTVVVSATLASLVSSFGGPGALDHLPYRQNHHYQRTCARAAI
jgi:hypothetical protein